MHLREAWFAQSKKMKVLVGLMVLAVVCHLTDCRRHGGGGRRHERLEERIEKGIRKLCTGVKILDNVENAEESNNASYPDTSPVQRAMNRNGASEALDAGLMDILLDICDDINVNNDDHMSLTSVPTDVSTDNSLGKKSVTGPTGMPNDGVTGMPNGGGWQDRPTGMPNGGVTGMPGGGGWQDRPTGMPGGGGWQDRPTGMPNGGGWQDRPTGMPNGGPMGRPTQGVSDPAEVDKVKHSVVKGTFRLCKTVKHLERMEMDVDLPFMEFLNEACMFLKDFGRHNVHVRFMSTH